MLLTDSTTDQFVRKNVILFSILLREYCFVLVTVMVIPHHIIQYIFSAGGMPCAHVYLYSLLQIMFQLA